MASLSPKFQRVIAALHGQEVDRVPVSAWGHDFLQEWSPQGLATATLNAYRAYDWDYIKINPRATYYAEAWGARYRPSGNAEQGPELERPGVASPADLRRIKRVDVGKGPFAEQLEALRLISRDLDGEAPFLQTVFTPLAVLSRLTGNSDTVRTFFREHPDDLLPAVEAIAETLADYTAACLEAGASGIFLATVEWGNYNDITEEEFDRWVRPYDLRILAAVRAAPFNILHVCRNHNQLLRLLDYPVHAFHWAANAPGNPSLQGVAGLTDKAVMGGVDQTATLVSGSTTDVVHEAQIAIAQTGGRRFLLAPGCSIPPA
ncbi:MAG TPA: uroporphyrinogen decarboxylase family protein, partial [Dehalococcoidia bacterium]|nr:uroporphyrinogen decarboxylase family protein [Dehalococcoidia bacterium]